MRDLSRIFGRSPFEPLVEHARKVHECVEMIGPIADAVVAGQYDKLVGLQHRMSKTEYEADLLKDRVRQRLPGRYFLPVSRQDVGRFLSQMDKIADGAEDFAVVSTLRKIRLPESLHEGFLTLVDKVVQVSQSLVEVAEHLAELQRDSFVGHEAEEVLTKIDQVAHMEWESDKLSRRFARQYYGMEELDPVTIILLDKMCACLRELADHAENVGKNLRLMISRR